MASRTRHDLDLRPIEPPRDPRNPFDERRMGVAMLGSVTYGLVTGLGVGAFVMRPYVGLIAGGALGLLAGIWLVPALMRDWRR